MPIKNCTIQQLNYFLPFWIIRIYENFKYLNQFLHFLDSCNMRCTVRKVYNSPSVPDSRYSRIFDSTKRCNIRSRWSRVSGCKCNLKKERTRQVWERFGNVALTCQQKQISVFIEKTSNDGIAGNGSFKWF